MLNAEMDQHLDNEAADGRVNTCNGCGQKTVLTGTGRLALDIPRDRQGTFDPQLIAKYQRCFPGFDDKIVSMYARGMSVREIQGHIRELYGVHLLRTSLDFVSWKDRKAVAAALKDIYRAPGPCRCGRQPWRRSRLVPGAANTPPSAKPGAALGARWCRSMPFPPRSPDPQHHERHRGAEREAAPRRPRQGAFPTHEAALKLLFLVLNKTEKEWTMPPREWCMAKAQFAVLFGERFAKAPA